MKSMTWMNFKYTFLFICIFLIIVFVIYDSTIGSMYYSRFAKDIYPKAKQNNVRSDFDERRSALSNLTDIIQRRIRHLQFPSDCAKVKALRCSWEDTGFGSQMHFRAICLIAAYTTGRTWIPDGKKPFKYSPSWGWDGYFLPVTNCTDEHLASSNNSVPDVLRIHGLYYKSSSMPPAFPAEFAEILLRYHAYPPLFWVAQFQVYLIRYQPFLEKYLDRKMATLGFDEPVVGVHVRRSDKVTYESIRFDLDEYMTHARKWFDTTGGGHKRRKVFLITDEAEVLREAAVKYPDYEFIHDYSAAIMANNLSSRYTHENLLDIVAGIHMLSRCTYAVCTFSSNICKLAYELAQLYRMDDWTDRFVSLDGLWYFWDQEARYQIAVDNHKANGSATDIDLLIGDLLIVNDNPWLLPNIQNLTDLRTPRNLFDGRFEGRNVRTGHFGRYPASKVHEKWQLF